MKPLPKWVGWVGALGALAVAVAHGAQSGDWSQVLPAAGAVMALISHSATGTGGKG